MTTNIVEYVQDLQQLVRDKKTNHCIELVTQLFKNWSYRMFRANTILYELSNVKTIEIFNEHFAVHNKSADTQNYNSVFPICQAHVLFH